MHKRAIRSIAQSAQSLAMQSFGRTLFVTLGISISLGLIALVSGSGYSDARSELLDSALRRVNSSSYALDAVASTQVIYQTICQSQMLDDCSVEVFQGVTLIASVPTIISRSWLRIDSQNFTLPSFSPELRGRVRFNPSQRLLLKTFVTGLMILFLVFACMLLIRYRLASVSRERELLLAKNQAQLGELAAQVAHDIRSPVSALKAFIARPDLHSAQGLDMIQAAATRIERIAEELLKANRIHSSSKLEPTPVVETPGPLRKYANRHPEQALKDLIEGIVKTMAFELSLRTTGAIRITFMSGDITRDSNFFLRFELADFERVLTNLLKNSIEAIASDGFISVEILHENSDLLLVIRDNGSGISEEDQTKLFQRGFSSGKTNGNGLGLYGAQRLIDSWGGSINIMSTKGRGTTVTIRLPVCTDL